MEAMEINIATNRYRGEGERDERTSNYLKGYFKLDALTLCSFLLNSEGVTEASEFLLS
jgi:hypothetical protein